jgi:hypothetical protein
VGLVSSAASVASLIFFLHGRAAKNGVAEDSSTTSSKYECDVLVCSVKNEFYENFDEFSAAYGKASGKVVKCISGIPNENDPSFDAHLASSASSDIFTVSSFDELEKQKNSGLVLDFLNASEKTFRSVADSIPPVLRLKLNEINNCGVPLDISGLGLAVNMKAVAALFGDGKIQSVVNSLKACSYDEFEKFALSVLEYISGGGNVATIGGTSYKFLGKGVLENVFAAHSEIDFTKTINPILSAVFTSASDFRKSDSIEGLRQFIVVWMKLFDLVTGVRPFLINSQKQAIKSFANGQALFLLTDNSAFKQIKTLNASVASSMAYIPLKIPLGVGSIKSGKTLKQINSSITVFAPIYLVINAKSQRLKASQDFLTWLLTSPEAKRILTLNCGYSDFSVLDVEGMENSLSRSVLGYLKSDCALPAVFAGAGGDWKEAFNSQITKTHLIKKIWSTEDYNNFADFCVRKW